MSSAREYQFKNPRLADPDAAGELTPVKRGDVPFLAVKLGMIDHFSWKLYNQCTGQKKVADLAREFAVDIAEMRTKIDRLARAKLVTL